MPIRTRRGRSGAYRALWEWPLQGPLRFLVVLAVLAVVVAGLAALGTRASPGPRTGALPAVPDPAGRAAAPAPAGAVPELVPTTLPLSSAPPEALGVAARWAAAWVDRAAGPAWAEGLRPYTTQEYLPQLASADPANVPATRVTGEPRPVEVRPESVRVTVPTDAVLLDLLLVRTAPGDWRVASLDRAS